MHSSFIIYHTSYITRKKLRTAIQHQRASATGTTRSVSTSTSTGTGAGTRATRTVIIQYQRNFVRKYRA